MATRLITKEILLLLLTVVAVLGGLVIGLLARLGRPSATAVLVVSFPGVILANLLKLLALPFLVTSLITSVSHMSGRTSGLMFLKFVAYVLVSNTLAAVVGLFVSLVGHPGSPDVKLSTGISSHAGSQVPSLHVFLDLLRNTFPENLVAATMKQSKTSFRGHVTPILPPSADMGNVTDYNYGSGSDPAVEMVVRVEYLDGINAVGICFICVVAGYLCGQMRKDGKPILKFVFALHSLLMRALAALSWYIPVGLVFMWLGSAMGTADLAHLAKVTHGFVFTVAVGLVIHTGLLMLLYMIITRKDPAALFMAVSRSLVTAFGTASSFAVLPITIANMEKNAGCDRRAARFVLSLGTMLNFNGTVLYQVVAVVFIAGINGINLSSSQVACAACVAWLASLTAGGIPNAGLVTMMLSLSSIGLPTNDIGILVGVDWIMDRLRTPLNVLSDVYGTGIVLRFSKSDLKKDEDASEDDDEKSSKIWLGTPDKAPVWLYRLPATTTTPSDSEKILVDDGEALPMEKTELETNNHHSLDLDTANTV